MRRLWPRSAPALAAFATSMAFSIVVVLSTGKHTIDINGERLNLQDQADMKKFTDLIS